MTCPVCAQLDQKVERPTALYFCTAEIGPHGFRFGCDFPTMKKDGGTMKTLSRPITISPREWALFRELLEDRKKDAEPFGVYSAEGAYDDVVELFERFFFPISAETETNETAPAEIDPQLHGALRSAVLYLYTRAVTARRPGAGVELWEIVGLLQPLVEWSEKGE